MNRYEEAIEKLANEYDAFFVENKYGQNTHAKEFELLNELSTKDNLVENALGWIKHEYDCYYKEKYNHQDSAFYYLSKIAKEK